MIQNLRKEEVVHCEKIPALIKYQRLLGAECSVPLHWHKEIELNLMLDGTGEFLINGKKELLTAGNINLINSEDIHMGEPPASIPVSERKLELITILWDYDFLLHYTTGVSSLRFDLDRCGSEVRDEIRNMVWQIGQMHQENALWNEMDITALLLQIGSRLMRNCVVPQEDTANRISAASDMQRAASYIDEHYSENLMLEAVAEAHGFSATYFSKKFKQVIGVTYKEYLGKCRIKHAFQELINTDMTINEIAYRNWFPNVKSFIEAFKREYGTTPQKHRTEINAS